MAQGQKLLDLMELVDNELQNQSSEADVTRSLLALNVAQDYLESILAGYPKIKGDATGTVVTTASTETTAFPPGLLRLDRLQLLNSDSLPKHDVKPVHETGGHAYQAHWPYQYYIVSATSTNGEPIAYYTDGKKIFWSPIPDDTYTVRWYGFQSATDITATGQVVYEDVFHFPLATFAAKLMALGKGDSPSELDAVAASTFGPAIRTLSNFQRDGAAPFEYTRIHIT